MIPDLPPDITSRPMGPAEQDVLLAFDAKRAGMGPHIAVRWGWDEQLQEQLHRAHYAAKPFFEITQNTQLIGTVSFQLAEDHARLGEFYIFATFQKKGTGTASLPGSC